MYTKWRSHVALEYMQVALVPAYVLECYVPRHRLLWL